DFIKQQIEQRIVAQRLNAKRQKVSQQLLKKIYAQHEIKINL
ncbi:MAG: DNA-binding transcriptional regulator LsrR (DeoR family), partial [Psychromonas sp.]